MNAAETKFPKGFGAIWSTVAVDLIGFGIVLPLLPLLAERTGASVQTIGVLVSTFSLAQLFCAPLLGRLSDRIGRKPVLLFSLFGTTVGSLLTGLAGGVFTGSFALAILFVGRLIDGASGASVSVAQAAVADIAAPSQRARLMGMLGAAFGVGFVLGPAIGGLGALVNPSLPFFIAALIAGTNGLIALKRLPETRPASTSREHSSLIPWRSPRPSADGVTEAANKSIVRRLAFVSFLATCAFASFEGTFALFLERTFFSNRDSVIASAALIFAIIGLFLMLVQGALVHPVVKKFGEMRVFLGGLVCNVVGFLMLSETNSLWQLAGALLLLVVGQGLLSPALSSLVAKVCGANRRGAAYGTVQAASGMGRVAGPIMGAVLFASIGRHAPAVAGAMVGAIAVLVAFTLARRTDLSAPPVDDDGDDANVVITLDGPAMVDDSRADVEQPAKA